MQALDNIMKKFNDPNILTTRRQNFIKGANIRTNSPPNFPTGSPANISRIINKDSEFSPTHV